MKPLFTDQTKKTPSHKHEMEKAMKIDKKNDINDLYQAVVISIFAVAYLVLDKKILKTAPPSIQKFDLGDTGKLVAVVTVSEMTREYLIKQKILLEHIKV